MRLAWLNVVLVLSIACPARADDVEVRITEAIEAHAAGDYVGARDRLRELSQNHRTPRVLRALAMCEVELGEMTDAYRALVEALASTDDDPGALSPAQRTHASDLLQRVTAGIARVSASGDEARIDDAPLVPASDGLTPLPAGVHTLERVDHDVTVRARVTLSAGEITTVDALLDVASPPPPPPPPPAPTPPMDSEPATAYLVQATPPRELRTAFLVTAAAMIGGHDGGNGWYPSAGPLVVLGGLTRFTDALSIGGTLCIAWSRLLDDAMQSQTHTWFSLGLRLAVEVRPSGSSFAFVGSIGPQLGSRARPDDVSGQRVDVGLEVELGPRLYVDGDLFFVGLDLRLVAGGMPGTDAALLLGLRTL